MELSQFYELIGYTGSLLVAFSLSMKSLQRLRIVNMVGAMFFIFYGVLIKALPIVLLNSLTSLSMHTTFGGCGRSVIISP